MAARTIHPFPARMASDIALERLDALPAQQTLNVLDPMCGSGTVLAAASSRGHSAQGFDVDPLAVLMSTVATKPIATENLEAQAEVLCAHARESKVTTPRWDDPETTKFSEYWFAEKQRVQLNRLTREMEAIDNLSIRQVLQVALSRTIVTKSPRASLAADTSHSRPHRVITESDYDVYEGFKKSVTNLKNLLDKRKLNGVVKVDRGDARALTIQPETIDLVITSPPYLNAIDYLRGHKMSLIWLGYTIPELRRIRSSSIGAERALDGEALDHVLEMVRLIKASVAAPDLLPLPTITRYAQDLVLFSRELSRVCKPSASVVTVIGNSTLRGNYIQNDLLVRKAYEFYGFEVLDRSERELPENRRYMPVRTANKDSSMAKRMRSEVVLEVIKP
ncbi:hypothetical protein [Timonella senegalensis]|uniref:hypothetical protein n=1 Tax=Timonella senegalensis TaxID=1465825 RepID=UPI002FDED5AC